jgi:general stress protein 26
LRARRLQPRIDRGGGLLWFLTDADSGKVEEIEWDENVGLVFINASERAYLSITARARILDDRLKAAHIWRKTDAMWWSGPNDPCVRVLRTTPLLAELWDGPSSTAIEISEFGKALLTASPPNLGENRKATVVMRWPPWRRADHVRNNQADTFRCKRRCRGGFAESLRDQSGRLRGRDGHRANTFSTSAEPRLRNCPWVLR